MHVITSLDSVVNGCFFPLFLFVSGSRYRSHITADVLTVNYIECETAVRLILAKPEVEANVNRSIFAYHGESYCFVITLILGRIGTKPRSFTFFWAMFMYTNNRYNKYYFLLRVKYWRYSKSNDKPPLHSQKVSVLGIVFSWIIMAIFSRISHTASAAG